MLFQREALLQTPFPLTLSTVFITPLRPFPFVTFTRHVRVSRFYRLRAVFAPLLAELSNNNQSE
jgi:hypothetical protein